MTDSDVEMVYTVEGYNGTRLVVIEPTALNAMRACRQISPAAPEAGGILIGERRGTSFVVKEVTKPTLKDESSRFKFVRKFHHHQLAVVSANQSSGGTSNYLGEWHTHPQDRPFPSGIDLKNWLLALRRHEPCLVSVVGRREEWWALHENGRFHVLSLLNKL
ncbi:MAG: Mov34/MPN/PAD-1 family protein [Gammaproteobacteria bacterium]|nr:Mov34/MPN/PAD-1 family protein [Gammaproteobacteria bacterium]MBU1556374.1 Mov34/MPN/PAD-1 family protein [Gammaproteobacteria bacterium]MBU2068990.1 Mov34/MPN/PAD-1 family protein [Gammaproteobacteria bacterium]MBU2183213.1 Mov34/MPN/PAD-1 family protein [Gammaproteobacteria bacterium]MBU2204593.1 Mov34/MPN/PAD-1 family protein [Gammaproteobacteria bacterium]